MKLKALLIIVLLFVFACGESDEPTEPEDGPRPTPVPGVVSTPSFSPPGGIYNTDLQIRLECATQDAIIYFTTDGEAPTMASTRYQSPISLTGDGSTITIRAIALKEGMQNSDVAVYEYSIDVNSQGYDCNNPHPDWLFCEDFEWPDGNFTAWYHDSDFISGQGIDDRGRMTLVEDRVHSGQRALFMPAAASSSHQGAGLDWWACDGRQKTNCNLRSYERLYFRAWVRFAPDHRYIHHFLNISGSQPDDFWYHGTAGCLPDGILAMGTTVDYRENSRESFFYTYSPDMTCDTRCDRYMDVDARCQECLGKGLPTCDEQPQCCWGNHYEPAVPVTFPVDEWFCLEMMMQANTPGEHDGVMAYWINGEEIHRETTMMWRISPTLALNRVRLQHYITSSDAMGHSNRVWFDDVVVSTSPIGGY